MWFCDATALTDFGTRLKSAFLELADLSCAKKKSETKFGRFGILAGDTGLSLLINADSDAARNRSHFVNCDDKHDSTKTSHQKGHNVSFFF